MNADPLDLRWKLAVEIAREAGRSTLRYFQTDRFQVERKGDQSPVTIADRDAETLLRERIAAVFPDDAIVGEEFGVADGSSGWRWILDPIDGTKSFITGVPLYGTLVGVDFEQRPQIGVIYIPGLDELVHAARGQGAWYSAAGQPQRRAHVSERPLAEGVFLTSQVDGFAHRGAAEAFHGLERQAYITRTWGDCYGYLLVAIGRAEVMVDAAMNLWDAAAIQPILEEAGGAFTDWSGQPRVDGGDGVGANRAVLDDVLAVTRPFATLC